MKNVLNYFLIQALIGILAVGAQAQPWYAAQYTRGTETQKNTSVATDHSGNVYVAGYSAMTSYTDTGNSIQFGPLSIV